MKKKSNTEIDDNPNYTSCTVLELMSWLKFIIGYFAFS